MDSTMSSRYSRTPYQAVPDQGNSLELQTLPRHRELLRESPHDLRERRFSFEGQGLDEEEPCDSAAEPPAGRLKSPRVDTGSLKELIQELSRNNERWRKWKKAANRWWCFELLGAGVSLACYVALVDVLRRSEGKEQTRWLYNRLTLNGLVALLSTFMRAAMMLGVGASLSQLKWNHFSSQSLQDRRGRKLEDLDAFDQASRGPSGSLMLLLAWTSPHLGLIGALITVLTLAFDAFAQEVIILRYENISGLNGTTVGQLSRSFANDLNTIAAQYNGIFNWQNISAPQVQCSTGNCTWPIVPSLGVCGSCTDVTAGVNVTCAVLSEDEAVANDHTGNLNCTYTIPGAYASSFAVSYTFWTVPGGLSGTVSDAAFIVVPDYSIPAYNQSNYLYLNNWLMIDTSDSHNNITATVCASWFCVQAYSTSVTNGVLDQTIVGTWSETDASRAEGTSFGTPINFTSVPTEYQINGSYSVAQGTLMAFEQNPFPANGNATYGWDVAQQYIYTDTTVRSLMNIVDYKAWIDRFALGMSYNIRSTGTASAVPSSTYAGHVFTSVALVHVRWAWLAFPASMVVASLLFLAACIWQTSRLRLEPRKGDALALLLASVGDEIKQESTERWRVGEEIVWMETLESGAVFRRLGAKEA